MYHQKYFNLNIVKKSSLNEFFSLYNKAKYVYFDTETSGLSVRHTGKDYVVGYTFSFEDSVSKDVFYIPVRHVFEGKYEDGERFNSFKKDYLKKFPDFCPEKFHGEYYNVDAYDFAQRLKEVMERGGKTYIAHNISYDLHVIANEGIDIFKCFENNSFDDTQIMVHTIDENEEKNLEHITTLMFHVEKSHYAETVQTVTKEEKLAVGLKANMNASFQHVQIPIGAQYSGEDVWFMKQMYPQLIQGLKDDEQYDMYYKNRIPFMKVLWKMERKGVKIDTDSLDKMQSNAQNEAENFKYRMFELAGAEFNPDSAQNVYELLFGFKKKVARLNAKTALIFKEQSENLTQSQKTALKKRYMSQRECVEFNESYNECYVNNNFGFKPVEWTDGGQYEYQELKTPKVGKDELKKLLSQKVGEKGKQFIKELIGYKKLSKLISAFMIGLREQIYEDGKVHCSLNLTGTDSWRLSSQYPNLQQLPHPLEEPKEGEDRSYFDFWSQFEIRKLFVADDGYEIVASDYHALEKFLTAHLSQDEMLIKMMRENLDPHGTVATIVFPELKDVNPNDVKKTAPDKRQVAKKIGFAVDYGGSKVAVAKNLEISEKLAQQYIDKYFEGFAGLHAYDKAVVKFAKEHCYVKTIGGHKRHLWDINTNDRRVSSYLERVAVNVMSQGSGADVAMFAQIDIDSDPILNSIGAYMVMNVHDKLSEYCHG